MNPSQKPNSVPTLVRDVRLASSLNTEIVDNIPVKNPLGSSSFTQSPPANSPVAKVFKPSVDSVASAEDQELDHILRDVNDNVKRAENSIEARFEHLSGVRRKVAVKKSKLDEAHHGSPPIVATLVACLVALALTAAAFYIYRKGY